MSIIDPIFAQKLMKLIQKETNQNAHFFGEKGIIIATTQPERLGTIHEGAKDIMSGKIDFIAITEEMTMQLSGTRPGFSVAIDTENQRIGAIGISGNPTDMRPIAMIASHMIVIEYERKLFMDDLNQMANNINTSLQESSAGLEELSASSEGQSSTIVELSEMVKKTQEEIMETNKILDFIHKISKQTTILGINASIEAARIGAEGKGFNVVANEVRKLADNTANSVGQVDDVLSNLKELITNVSDNITSYSSATHQQATVIQSLSHEIENITTSVDVFVKKLT
ncbi:methyl-accepting chemotaxis sensory transducer [Alkaliphilus metalliredigens QYMF]|uniref:Methyl-accepting chemotaxis sensory transducer n=1 Tax=Alkaliphilus metalliredigens (strain QYMF) TaxID=293826 RepID=A6TL32_ALKMQ|nr:sugar diacid recognition domain-containing protein [Alkaliphilus metalliredigens]ABR46900.1 methyl-accepting chemotaxis sensory transducer [Alkaliphilus metalliredigens QYMF]